MDVPPSGDVCCVCHERFRLPCQANCSHWFCGNCILRVWNSGFVLQPCKCPLCRRAITLLIPASTINEDHDREAYQVLQSIENYNRQFGRNPSLIQSFQDVPFFIRRLLREFMDPQRALPFVFRARTALSILLSIGYVAASPFNMLSERIHGFVGFLDDFLVLVIVLIHLAALYRGLLLNRHGGAA